MLVNSVHRMNKSRCDSLSSLILTGYWRVEGALSLPSFNADEERPDGFIRPEDVACQERMNGMFYWGVT
jgi:hypothetical protein